MRALLAFGIIFIMTILAACVPPLPAPIDSPIFARRAPLPGQPGYLETIKYVDDGLRYIAPGARFLVSADGEMCFLGSIVPGVRLELLPEHYWCMSPFDVSTVDALENDTSYVNRVRLWCRHSSPQCARKIAYPDQFDDMTVANSITAETIPFRRERDAIAYLVYLMGGNIGPNEAEAGGPIPLDSAR